MKKPIIFIIIEILFYISICWCCCCSTEANADTVGCMVYCEVPEEPVRYIIPKIKGNGYFEISNGKIIHKTFKTN